METQIAPKIDQLKLYFPCEVYRKDMNKVITFTGFSALDPEEDGGRLTDDGGIPGDEVLLVGGFSAKWSIKAFMEKGCRLLLRPLSSLTKEEALIISDIVLPANEGSRIVLEIKRTSFIVKIELPAPFISATYQVHPMKFYSVNLDREDVTTVHNPIELFQYLLKKKFDLGLLPKSSYVLVDTINGGFTEPK